MDIVHFSSETTYWSTPQWLFDALDREFGFTLDVCATVKNAKWVKFFSEADHALLRDWDDDVCWMNPPYGTQKGCFRMSTLQGK